MRVDLCHIHGLWNVPEWKLLRQFDACHDLPVTGIAARPYPVPLQGEEEDGIAVHVRTASADSTLTRLTLQTKIPRPLPAWDPNKPSGVGACCYRWATTMHRLLQLIVLILLVLMPMGQRAGRHCGLPSSSSSLRQWTQCVWDHAFLAPVTRPGVGRPPY